MINKIKINGTEHEIQDLHIRDELTALQESLSDTVAVSVQNAMEEATVAFLDIGLTVVDGKLNTTFEEDI